MKNSFNTLQNAIFPPRTTSGETFEIDSSTECGGSVLMSSRINRRKNCENETQENFSKNKNASENVRKCIYAIADDDARKTQDNVGSVPKKGAEKFCTTRFMRTRETLTQTGGEEKMAKKTHTAKKDTKIDSPSLAALNGGKEKTEEKKVEPITMEKHKIDALDLEVDVYIENVSGNKKSFARRKDAAAWIKAFRKVERVPVAIKTLQRYLKRLNGFELGKQIPTDLEDEFFLVLDSMIKCIDAWEEKKKSLDD